MPEPLWQIRNKARRSIVSQNNTGVPLRFFLRTGSIVKLTKLQKDGA